VKLSLASDGIQSMQPEATPPDARLPCVRTIVAYDSRNGRGG